jgi:hypothetical protein
MARFETFGSLKDWSSKLRDRLPPPRTTDETAACVIIRDKDGQALAYVYFEDEPGRRAIARPQHSPQHRSKRSADASYWL